jgi:hypothetical protein
MAFSAADGFPGIVPVGTPHWLPGDVITACTRGNTAWLLRLAEAPVLEIRTLEGQLVSSSVLVEPFAGNQGGIAFWQMAAQRELLWVGVNQRLVLYRNGTLAATWEAETPIRALIPSAPNLPLCTAVALHKGVSLHWADNLKSHTETLCEELINPLAAFTANGTLILVSANQGRICDVGPAGVKTITEFTFPIPPAEPIALVRAGGPNQFALFSKDGKVQLFRVAD